MKALKMALSLLGGVAAPSAPANAYTESEHSLREVLEESNAVVEGVVTGYRIDQQPHMVFVHYTVRVDRSLTGAPLAEVEVTLPGGVLANGRTVHVPGAPYLVPGEHVLLSLTSWPEQRTHRLPSWSLGVLRKVNDGAYIGADMAPISALACDSASSPAQVVTPDPQFASNLASDDAHQAELYAPMAWDDAVAVVETCLAAATQ